MPPLMRHPLINAISPRLLVLVILLLALLPRAGRANDAPLLHGTLPDGVRLLIRAETEPEIKQVAISLFVRLDSVAPEEEATAEMVARTLFYGTPNRTANGILTLAADAGNDIEVLATPHYVGITYVTSPPQLTEAVHLICDCLKSADFRPESLRSALKTLRTERDRAHIEPLEMGKQRLKADLNAGHSDLDSLQRVTQRQAQQFFRTHYVPANTVISVAGRVDPQQALRLFTAFLLDYTRSSPSRFATRQEPSPMPQELETVPDKVNGSFLLPPPTLLPSPTGVAYALVGTAAPAVTSPDYPAFTVLETLLGGGHASRLFVGSRERLGVGYQVGALYQADRFALLILSIQWDPQRKPLMPDSKQPTTDPIEEARPDTSMPRLLNSLIDALISHPPTVAELERARNFAIGRDALRHELLRDRAFFPGWYETLGLHYTFDRELPILLAKVTQEDILRVARTYLNRRATVLLLPPTP